MDVGWKRNVAVGFERLPDRNGFEAQKTFAVIATAFDDGGEIRAEVDALARAELAAWTHQRQPGEVIGRNGSNEKRLNFARVTFSMTVQAGRNYARIIENEAIPGAEVRREIAEVAVFEASRFTVDHEHARCGPILQGFLRDSLRRQVEIEIREAQRGLVTMLA